jgi:predicted SAM-dependent methyltransferase
VQAAGLYVNVGCGLVAPADWINLDGSLSVLLGNHPLIERVAGRVLGLSKAAWPSGIRHWDVRDGLPFGDGGVDGVYASHFLEHLSYRDAGAFLADCRRVLRPGGTIRIIVPDLQAITAEYLRATSSDRAEGAADRFLEALACCPVTDDSVWLIRRLRAWKQLNVHKWMYDEMSLCGRVRAAGFTDVHRCGFMESDLRCVRTVEREISFVHGLCVEGRTPDAHHHRHSDV